LNELQKAVISLIKASTAKDCPFSSCMKDLSVRPNVQKYIRSAVLKGIPRW
jgi:hypothetical protein